MNKCKTCKHYIPLVGASGLVGANGKEARREYPFGICYYSDPIGFIVSGDALKPVSRRVDADDDCIYDKWEDKFK